jgi:hypothetical protein
MTPSLKKTFTQQFDKSKFHLLDHNTGEEDSILCVDERLREFITKLNECPHIMTIYSCEGHERDKYAYLSFSVDEKGWDLFWQNVMPELTFALCSVNPETPPELESTLIWHVMIIDNEHGEPHINLYCKFDSCGSTVGNISWEERKECFWKVMIEVFLRNFNAVVA